jgi:hypothetical protein
MRRFHHLLVAGALACAAGAAPADPGTGASAAAEAASGESEPARSAQTRAWLAQQRAANPERAERGLSAEARGHALERYLESFRHPIPERFDLDALERGEP